MTWPPSALSPDWEVPCDLAWLGGASAPPSGTGVAVADDGSTAPWNVPLEAVARLVRLGAGGYTAWCTISQASLKCESMPQETDDENLPKHQQNKLHVH